MFRLSGSQLKRSNSAYLSSQDRHGRQCLDKWQEEAETGYARSM